MKQAVRQDQTLCLDTKNLLILKQTLNVICKIRGKEARLGNLVFRTVGQAVGGAYWNPFPAQLRAGIWGKGFLAARTKPSLLQGSVSPSCWHSLPHMRYLSTGLQPDVSPPTWTSQLPATKSPHILLALEKHCSKALCSDWLLTSRCYALDFGGCWGNQGFFFSIMQLVITWPVSSQMMD